LETGKGGNTKTMSKEKEIRVLHCKERRSKTTDKYSALPRNRQTENDILRIFEHGTERELMPFLGENGLKDDAPRFGEILKLFREHGAKRQ
jgi:hypothetical protein